MADIDIRREHPLGLKGARKAAETMAAHLGQRFGLSGDWEGDTLHFERPGVTGALTVTERDLHLTVALGFLLKALRPSIERAVQGELEALLAKAPAATAKKAPKPPRKGGS
jgi:putative polyhydroxyalkanoate system protein